MWGARPLLLSSTVATNNFLFTADIANLSRIVTLNNLGVVPNKDGTLALEATAKTFRYLDVEEVNAQRKAQQGAKKK